MRTVGLTLLVAVALSSAPARAAAPDAGAATGASDAGAAPDAAPTPRAADAATTSPPVNAPTPAPAPPPAPKPHHKVSAEDRAAAKRDFEGGNQAYKAGQYLLAARAYEEAYRLDPLPAITFSIAQAYRLQYYQDHKLEHLRRALKLYHRYLDDAPHGDRRGHATTHIEAIESILGSATAEPGKASPTKAVPTQLMVVSHTPHARARIDGGELEEVPFARGVAPGNRVVEVEAPGYATARSRWLAVKGRLVVATIELHPLPAALEVRAPADATVRIDGRPASAGSRQLPAGTHVVTITERGRLPVTRRLDVGRGQTAKVNVGQLERTDQRVAATWTLIGAGTLAVAGGITTALALSEQKRVNDYDQGIGQHTYSDAQRTDRNNALASRNTLRTASWALFGTAAALGITGGLLWWLDEPGRESVSTGGLTPLVAPTTAGATWRTAF